MSGDMTEFICNPPKLPNLNNHPFPNLIKGKEWEARGKFVYVKDSNIMIEAQPSEDHADYLAQMNNVNNLIGLTYDEAFDLYG